MKTNKKPYFGAVHLHTEISREGDLDNKATPLETLEHLRDVFQVDFAALTDHSNYFWDRSDWTDTVLANEEAYEPGKFATVLGYEWTHPIIGHENILFRENSEKMPLIVVSALKDWPSIVSIEKLWEELSKLGDDVFTIKNHPADPNCTASLDKHHDMEKLIEIANYGTIHEGADAPGVQDKFVKYGNFVQDALIRGWKVGFAGGLDHHHLMKKADCFTGVWADKLTRDSVFDSLIAKRTFASTNEKIAVDFKINNIPMGGEINFGIDDLEKVFPLRMDIEIHPTEELESVEIIDVYKPCHSFEKSELGNGEKLQLFWEFENEFVYDYYCNCYNRCFYVRIEQKNGSLAWSSPVYINFIHPEVFSED